MMHSTSTPGSLIGYRKDGRPIHLIAGGSGEGDPNPDPKPSAPDGDPAPGGTPQGGDGGSAQPPAAPSGDHLPQESKGDAESKGKGPEPKTFGEDYVKKLREEAAERRTTAKELEDKLDASEKRQQAQMDAIAKALGLKQEDTPPDPDELTRKLAASQAEARRGQVELAVYHAAGAHEARADLLLDSRSFMRAAEGLDPTAADFNDRLSKAITDQVEANDRFKAKAPAPADPPKPPAPKRSGGEFNSPGGSKPITREQLESMSPDEIAKAHADGRLNHLL